MSYIMLTIQQLLFTKKGNHGYKSMCLDVCKIYYIIFDELLH